MQEIHVFWSGIEINGHQVADCDQISSDQIFAKRGPRGGIQREYFITHWFGELILNLATRSYIHCMHGSHSATLNFKPLVLIRIIIVHVRIISFKDVKSFRFWNTPCRIVIFESWFMSLPCLNKFVTSIFTCENYSRVLGKSSSPLFVGPPPPPYKPTNFIEN